MMSPYGTFKTKDGYINIAAGNQGMWERLAKTLGLEHLIQDKRFLTVADRVANRPELMRLLEEKLAEKTIKEWEAVFDEARGGEWAHPLCRRGLSRSSGSPSEDALRDGSPHCGKDENPWVSS